MVQQETKHISSVYCTALKITDALNCKKSAQRKMTCILTFNNMTD